MTEVRWDLLHTVATSLADVLTREARGTAITDEEREHYAMDRDALVREDATAKHIPDFVRRCRTLDDFTAYKRTNFANALECESFVRDELDDLLSMLEGSLRSETPPFARPVDKFLSPLVELLMLRGSAREVALLAVGESLFHQSSYDGWDGGQWGWGLRIYLDPALYARLDADDRSACEAVIKQTANEVLGDEPAHSIGPVEVLVRRAVRTNWRERASAWLKGDGVNNQGRVRSDNIASRQHDGLLFRSRPEMNVYDALKATGVAFAPLPVFLHGGATYQRIEPDFVVFKRNRVMVIEVDGDTVHVETPAEADQRTRMFKYAGAFIEHVRASDCDTLEKAKVCVARMLNAFDDWRSD